MNDPWSSDEDEDSRYSCMYSDEVDSDLEAELYSVIHHQDKYPSEKHAKVTESNTDMTEKITEENETVTLNNVTEPSISSEHKISASLLNTIKVEDEIKLSGSKPDSSTSKPGSSSTFKKSASANFDNTIVISDQNESSSDCDIWCEKNSFQKSHIQMNIDDDDVIFLSSDESDDSVVSVREKRFFKHNKSLPNVKIGESSKGSQELWYVNDEDKYRRRNTSRYHERRHFCCRCHSTGHSKKFCPLIKGRKCFFCGGSHPVASCRKKMCSRCNSTGHSSGECYLNAGIICRHCHMSGHTDRDCPDVWRRYHLTTTPGNIVKGKILHQDKPVYCFNCGMPGHCGAECRQPRILRDSFPTWPSVISYDDPKDLLSKNLAVSNNSYNHINFNPSTSNRNFNRSFNRHAVQDPTANNFSGAFRNQKRKNKPDSNECFLGMNSETRKNGFNCSKTAYENFLAQRRDVVGTSTNNNILRAFPKPNKKIKVDLSNEFIQEMNFEPWKYGLNCCKSSYESLIADRRKIRGMIAISKRYSKKTDKSHNVHTNREFVKKIEELPIRFPNSLKQILNEDCRRCIPDLLPILRKYSRTLSNKMRLLKKRKRQAVRKFVANKKLSKEEIIST